MEFIAWLTSELAQAVKAKDYIIARSALPKATLPLHQHGVSPVLQSEFQYDGKNLPRQAEQTNASVVVNVCRITLFEKRHYESLLPILRYNTLVPHTGNEGMQHLQTIPAAIFDHLWGYPTHPGSFTILKGIDSSFNFREGGHLFRWLFLNYMSRLSLQPCAHERLHWPVTVQQLLKVLLSDVCLLLVFDVRLPSDPRSLPAAKDCTLSSSSLSPTRLCALYLLQISLKRHSLGFPLCTLVNFTDFLQSLSACLYCLCKIAFSCSDSACLRAL